MPSAWIRTQTTYTRHRPDVPTIVMRARTGIAVSTLPAPRPRMAKGGTVRLGNVARYRASVLQIVAEAAGVLHLHGGAHHFGEGPP